jgi:ferric-dicitrate binding protein FerR (iron transport regulator)
MPEQPYNILLRKLLDRTASKEDKNELRRLWERSKGNPDPEQLLPYEDWLDTPGEGTLPRDLHQRTMEYILSVDAVTEKTDGISPRRITRWLPAAAAAAILFVMAGIWLFRSTRIKAIPMTTITAAYGEKKILTLPDGSTVYLNGGSSLHFPQEFSLHDRMVRLEGEAFFEVKSSPDHPFVVRAARLATTVLGTSFNITAWPDETNTTVSVRTGKVRVATSFPNDPANIPKENEELELTAGARAVCTDQDHRLAAGRIAPADAGSWKDNLLIFDNAGLGEICHALERKYNVRFAPASPDLLQYRYSIRFDGLTIRQSLDKLSLLGGLRFSRQDNRITIKGRP